MKRNVCAVFDIDDTLYLERDYVKSGFEAVGRWAATWIHIEDFADRCWHRFVMGMRRTIFDEVLREVGWDSNRELVASLVEIYRSHMPSISLAADASEALKEIYSMASIAVISDGPSASQSRKADALGLGLFASPIILTEIYGAEFRKPHPMAFQQVQRSRPASAYVYVADNPLKDFAAPKQLGWTTVRMRRPRGLYERLDNSDVIPDHEMADCSALPELLAHL